VELTPAALQAGVIKSMNLMVRSPTLTSPEGRVDKNEEIILRVYSLSLRGRARVGELSWQVPFKGLLFLQRVNP